MKRLVPVLFACSAMLVFACDGDEMSEGDEHGDEHDSHDSHESGEEHGSDSEGEHESGDEHGDSDEASVCDGEERVDAFELGLTKAGALIQASFVSADPAPPGKDNNTWVLAFSDLAGEPLTDLAIIAVPWMPDHGHGTPVEAVVTATGEPGRYEITPVNLFMTGYWEVNMELTLSGGEQDFLMFGFCVE